MLVNRADRYGKLSSRKLVRYTRSIGSLKRDISSFGPIDCFFLIDLFEFIIRAAIFDGEQLTNVYRLAEECVSFFDTLEKPIILIARIDNTLEKLDGARRGHDLKRLQLVFFLFSRGIRIR